MTFKFICGDTVFFIHGNKIREGQVVSRRMVESLLFSKHYRNPDHLKYRPWGDDVIEYAIINPKNKDEHTIRPESHLYGTKEELIASL